jgi:hypothetical protein
MGMFDTFIWDKESAPKCLEGHQIFSYQTKDLDCNMDTYYVYKNEVFQYNKHHTTDESVFSTYEKADISKIAEYPRALLLRRTDMALPCGFTSTVRMYANCQHCRPVLTAGTGPSWNFDRVQENNVWVELDVKIQGGSIKEIAHPKESSSFRQAGSRETLKKMLKEQGVLVLEDDNPIAVAHFYRKEN